MSVSAMIRVIFLLCLSAVLPLWAQTRILVIRDGSALRYRENLDGFREVLSTTVLKFDLTVVESTRVVERLPELRGEVPQLVLTQGPKAAIQALTHFYDLPVIATLIPSDRLLDAHKNMTGVPLVHPLETQLVWMKQMVSDVDEIGVIHGPANRDLIARAQPLARSMGINLLAHEIQGPTELPEALGMLTSRVDLLWGIPDEVVMQQRTAKAVLLASFRGRVPFVGTSSSWVKAGALYALDWDFRDLGRQCGQMAARILVQGQPVAAVAVETPRTITYTLNLKTVEHMRLSMSERLLQAAKLVYR